MKNKKERCPKCKSKDLIVEWSPEEYKHLIKILKIYDEKICDLYNYLNDITSKLIVIKKNQDKINILFAKEIGGKYEKKTKRNNKK